MQFIKLASFCVFCALSVGVATPSRADPYSDDLAKCLVSSTTQAQKTVVIQWLFATIALHPSVAPMAKISKTERTTLNEETGKLFTQLLTVTCKKQAQQAALFDGPSALESAFSILGRSAMMGLMGDPKVADGMNGWAKYVDSDKIQKTLFNQSSAAPASSASH